MLDDITSNVLYLAGFLVVISLSRYITLRGDPTLDAIPTVGFSDPILSYLSAIRSVFDFDRMLKEGYYKTRPGLFKIAGFQRWMVLAAGPELIDDIWRATDDVLSVTVPTNELIQSEYTLEVSNPFDEYITSLVRSKLARNIAVTFKDGREELVMAMDDLVPIHKDKWMKVPIRETMERVICRTTNRIFVGAPLCRNHDYQTLNLTFATNLIKAGLIISLFPKPFKFIVSRVLSNLPSQIQQEIEYIKPMVEERIAKMEEYGEDWDDKPSDMLMWLMTETQKVDMSVKSLARRMLAMNLVAIHSTSSTMTQVLYRLLTHPEYIEPLREEVDAVISEEGWTKAGIDKMHKIDSFLRETQRVDGIALRSMSRLALRPFTFSNGVTVPAGTEIAFPSSAAHKDESVFTNPDVFDGFRFAKLRESEGDVTNNKYQTVTTSHEQLSFGVGRHACPGRFFAVNEIKRLLAHIVATYDFKFEEGKGAPRDFFLSMVRFPGNANAMFRARQK